MVRVFIASPAGQPETISGFYSLSIWDFLSCQDSQDAGYCPNQIMAVLTNVLVMTPADFLGRE